MSRRSRKANPGALRAQRRRLEAEVAALEARAAELRAWVGPLERAGRGLGHALDLVDSHIRAARRQRVDVVIAAGQLGTDASEWSLKEAHNTMVTAINDFLTAAEAAKGAR